MSEAAGMQWRPSCDVETARGRAAMLARARSFFADRGVLEVETPALGATTVTDPNIDSLAVRSASAGLPELFLQTSPEYYMKRLLSAGYPDIYQICKVFRDGESGRRHQPEFTMVEWYRLGFDLQQIMRETVDFVLAVTAAGRITREARCISYRDVFRDAIGIDPLTSDTRELERLSGADDRLRESLAADRDAWLDLLMSQRVSAGFPDDGLTVLYHYPASQAALARRCPDDDSVADRFEVFCGTLELANGFVELTDADEQLDRFARDNSARGPAGKPQRTPDVRLLAALRSGLPDCAGVAVGLDRLLMLQEQADDIRSVQTFTVDVEIGDGDA